MKLHLTCNVLLLSLLACERAPTRALPGTEPSGDGPASVLELAPYPSPLVEVEIRKASHLLDIACLADGQRCEGGESRACCPGSFCTADLLAYGPQECSPPQPDGAFCLEEDQCASGQCINSTCASACLSEGADCYDGQLAPCCEGLICDFHPAMYGVARCVAPMEVGSFCFEGSDCKSGICEENVCVASACHQEGDLCYDAEIRCCSGLFCSFDATSYGLAYCIPLLAPGSACLSNEECASASCADGSCS